MTELTTVEYFFAVNQAGDSACSPNSLQEAIEHLTADFNNDAVRTWSVNFTLTLPTTEALDVPLPVSSQENLGAVKAEVA